jgi:CHRD domain-containing protein
MRKVIVIGVIALGVLGLVAGALAAHSSDTYSFKAALTRGAEVPKPKGAPASAGGTFVAHSVEAGSKITIRWTLKFHGLSGKAMAAHIHLGKKGVSGPVVVPLCGPCKATSSGSATITSKVENALEKGGAYVNVHTAKNAAGEIRGQVKLTGK